MNREELARELARTKRQLERTTARADRQAAQLASIRGSRAWKLIEGYRRLRTGRPSSEPDRDPDAGTDDATIRDGAARVTATGETHATVSARDVASMARFRASMHAWADRARSAPGDDVVVMFSGTTFVQESRGNRPIRVTNVYLEQRSPVFFNYYRWRDDDALPEHPDELLFQSPIDVTAKVLPELFDHDFGDRRKTYYVSFPHMDAVRMMSLAKSNGWTTVYDIRDDWEAFAEVGMAEWFDPAVERWTVQAADIVTAVSEPLAEKLRIDAGRDDIHVSANALDMTFPRRPWLPGPDDRVVGYFGHLTGQWFDWELVAAAATALPGWTFELAGHGAPSDVELPDNVHLLGLLTHQELAERSSRWAGGLIPFRNGPIVDPLDPIKVYEYVHLRLPTVAGYYPPMADYPGVAICESAEDFIAAIEGLPGRTVDDAEAEAFLSTNSWRDRVAQYAALVDDTSLHASPRGHFDGFLGGCTGGDA